MAAAELLRINMQLVGLFGSAGVSTAGAVRAAAQHLQKKMDFRRGREIAKCEYEPRHVCLSVCLSVRSDRIGRIFMIIYMSVFFGNL